MPQKLRRQRPLIEDEIPESKEEMQEGCRSIADNDIEKEEKSELIFCCTICSKSYKTLNQIKSHLNTKKHYKKYINYHFNNSTLNHRSEIPKSMQPSLCVEGNEFVRIIEQNEENNNNGMDSHQEEEGFGNNTISNQLDNYDENEQVILKTDMEQKETDEIKSEIINGQILNQFECLFCELKLESIEKCFDHMSYWHNFEIPCYVSLIFIYNCLVLL